MGIARISSATIRSPAKLNAVAGYLNFIVLALLTLAVSPILANSLGSVNYGIWRAAQRFLDFASVADGRATQGLKWVVAYRSGSDQTTAQRRSLAASVVVWVIWLPVLLLVGALIAIYLPHAIKGVATGERDTVVWVGAILCANVALAGLLNIPDSALVGVNRGYRSMSVTTVVLVLSNIAMLLCASAGFGLISLALTVLLAAVLNGLLTYLVARRHVSWWGFARPRTEDVQKLASFSGLVLLWELVNKLLLSTEILLLGYLVGASAVTVYSFSTYIVTFGFSICLITTSALMPQLGRSLGNGDLETSTNTVSTARQLTLAVAVVIACFALLLNRSFVTVWAGADRFIGGTANTVIVLAFLQLVLIRCDAQIQDTGLAIRTKVIVGLGSALTSVVGGFVAYAIAPTPVSVLIGVAVGRLPMTLVFPRLVSVMTMGRGLKIRPILVGACLLVAAWAVGLRIVITALVPLVATTIAVAAAIGVAVVGLQVPADVRKRLLRRGSVSDA